MKKRSLWILLAVLIVAAIMAYRNNLHERTVVILSTNDIHANLTNFARLAEAVRECRDTVPTVLVDAGDRWSGNAFVDLAEGRRPILDLMSELGYDVATLGNHEFDMGVPFLDSAIKHSAFRTICANVKRVGEVEFDVPLNSVVVKSANGIKLRFVGVVTNYDNGHPDGADSKFVGLEFPDPMECACADASKQGVHALVLLSHMGYPKDVEFADKCDKYDVIIGGHSHDVADTLAGRTVIGQTGCKLVNVGATTIRFKGNKIAGIDYRNIPLADYAEDAAVAARVAEIESNPDLLRSIGTLGKTLDKRGLADMQTFLVANSMHAQVGFYHYGGIRLSNLPAGDVSMAELFNIEPFFSYMYTMTMTPAQMRDMIITKYNDTGNEKESHRIDLFCTTPYTIVADAGNTAVDVLFPQLREGVRYKVAMGNYIAEKYRFEADDKQMHPTKLLDVMADWFEHHSPVEFDNTPKQKIVVRR
ncbi:MAG: bifunctional metallophosphatase/5'-nucleotidase [Alistipes sp.]